VLAIDESRVFILILNMCFIQIPTNGRTCVQQIQISLPKMLHYLCIGMMDVWIENHKQKPYQRADCSTVNYQ
jgi:hypothetical protein